jgi:glyoxylase-like metal-dependent hydrolase (beta-lactamase superfamily II)
MATEISKGDDKGGYRQINKALNICAFDDYLKSQAASLPHLPDVEQLTPRVLRVLGQNPGKFTFQGTNTFVIGTGTSRILVDTSGGEPEYAALLASALEARAISLKYVLITHWHGDHSGGAPDLARMYPHLKENIYKNDPEQGQQNIRDGQIFRVQGATITAVLAPGHSEDHMCFVLEEEKAMFTGDNILGHGTSAVEDLGLYMSSLQKMAGKNCITGYPAHGVTIDDLHAKIGTELAQKWRREKQVMGTLERLRERGEKSVIVRDLVTGIYGDAVDESTRTMALEPFIDEVLRKLAGDGRVGFEIRSRQKRWHSVPKKRCNRDMKFVQSAMQVQVCKVFDID